MGIKIKSVSKINPQDVTLPAKFYAQVVSEGITDLDRLTKLVSDGSTVRENDIYAVLIGLVNVIVEELADGRNVHLGTLGSFRVSVNSEGSTNTEDVTVNNIKKAKILYRPGKKLREKLKILTFSKISTP